jgi:hypothetical protein
VISYTPQFNPQPWVDFVDTVQAGGSNGFNARFQQIVTEFNTISAVVTQIATTLQTPVIQQRTLTLAPTLAATAQQPWAQQVGFVTTATTGGATPTMESSAAGFMPVNLPNAATIQGLRVTGLSAGGLLTISLQSQPLAGGAATTIIQIFNNFPAVAAAVAFDLPPTPQNANVAVNTATSKYYVVATLEGGNVTLSAGGTSLNAFQISYSST